jgi:choice-of-anchor A domain-containing protein
MFRSVCLSVVFVGMGACDGCTGSSLPTPSGHNVAPVLQNPGTLAFFEDMAQSVQLIATDANNDAIQFSTTDALPPGLQLTPSGQFTGTPDIGCKGDYDVRVSASDGLDSHSQTMTLQVDLGSPSICRVDDLLAEALAFNAFTVQDYVSGHSDVEGTVAVCGDLDVHSYSVGLLDPGFSAVGGDFHLTSGTVHGSIEVAGDAFVSNGTANDYQASTVDFPAIVDDLYDAANDLDTFGNNGTVFTNPFGDIVLSGLDTRLNVFRVDADLLYNVEITFDVPAGSAVLVQVDAWSVDWQSVGFDLGASSSSDIFWSLPNATSIRWAAIGVQGTVLAPNATVDFDDGQHNGHLLIDTFNGDGLSDGLPDGQINHRPFAHDLCP